MKCRLIFAFAWALFGAPFCLSGAQTPPANVAANFERREAEERYMRLHATVQSLAETQEMLMKHLEALQQRCSALERELERTRQDQARAALNAATREDLKQVVESVNQMESRRESDRQLMIKGLKDLAKAAPSAAEKKPAAAAKPSEGAVFTHTVEKGHTLSDIISAFNAEFQKEGAGSVTLEQVIKENPGLNPNKIHVGQVLRIPAPSKR